MVRTVFNIKQCLAGFALLFLSYVAVAAPVVEITEDRFRIDLPAYIDILEDPNSVMTLEDVRSERYTHQFSPSPLSDFYFGYTSSAYWFRFTVANQLDHDKRFIFEVTPADIDYIDFYGIDERLDEVLFHKRSGSAISFDQRDYDHPLYFFDVEIPAHTVHTFYVRLKSNKTVNVHLRFSSQREHFFYSGSRDWWQGVIFGGLLLLGFLHIALAFAFNYKGFAYCGLFMLSILVIQGSWNGYFLQFINANANMLDKQLMLSVYMSCAFGLLFTRTYLDTHHRAPLSHRLLTVMILLSLLGMPCAWLLSAWINALLMSFIALVGIFLMFGLALYSFLEGFEPAKYFLLARTLTMVVILIALFSAHGLLPQGFVINWGLSVCILFEGLVFACVMTLQQVKKQHSDRPEVVSEAGQSQGLVPVSAFCHELRTPISGVLGMSELLMETSLTDQQRSQMETIRNSGRSLLDVVNKMSDLSSLESGEVEVVETSFEILSVVESCVESSRDLSERRNIELIYQVEEAVTGFVKGDQDKLLQVMNNLISYTIRHMDGGEILISVREASLDNVLFEITSGKNTFAQDYSAALFNSDEVPTSADNLNLTIARQFIGLMGGELQINQRTDGGAKIVFQLLLKKQRKDSLHEDNDRILRGKRLMIVDDNETCCKIVQQQASQWGMDVMIAGSGKEALAILRSQANLGSSFDLMLVDYDMPGMNGIELVSKIRHEAELYRATETLMLILTGVSKMPSQLMSDNAGIHNVLYKPLSGKSLKLALIEAFTLKQNAEKDDN